MLQNNLFAIRYCVAGDMEAMLLPSRSTHPGRKDELWMRTCFECFLAREDEPTYWEFNFAPSGDWNAYRMDAYRRVGFSQELSIQQMKLETRQESDSFFLHAAVDLSPLFQKDDRLQAGITAVIQTKHGSEIYWALSHPASQADFHLRESFILRLEGQTRPVTQFAPDG